MLQEMISALNDANGVPEDIWFSILGTMGEQDPSVRGVSCFGGRYYVTDAQRNRLRQMIPFMNGQALALPAHVEPEPLRCNKCKGPFHPATGHAFTEFVVACHVCYGRFAAWQLHKYGWKPVTPKQRKKLDRSRRKAEKKAASAAKALVSKINKETSDSERLYGKPREAQHAGQNPILER